MVHNVGDVLLRDGLNGKAKFVAQRFAGVPDVYKRQISSYDANRRFIEMFGYKCTLQTDTEVITYIMDYLVRVQGLTLREAASVVAAPFWSDTEEHSDSAQRETQK